VRRWAINGALSHLGVGATLFGDRFDAVGLGRFRETEDWLEGGSESSAMATCPTCEPSGEQE